ncbi:MAG: hypothetical protein PVG75_14570 [Thioalkalispiraceae bacterium]|jgi:TPR repeat protein
MFNTQFIQKVGWLVSASSLGLTLVATVHAQSDHSGKVRLIAQADPHYAITQVRDNTAKFPMSLLSGKQALQRGKQLMQRARTPRQHIRAFEYLNYAAEKGLAEAQFQTAIMYLDDQYVPGNDERAMYLLEQASQQGHKQAGIALNYIRYGDDEFGC